MIVLKSGASDKNGGWKAIVSKPRKKPSQPMVGIMQFRWNKIISMSIKCETG